MKRLLLWIVPFVTLSASAYAGIPLYEVTDLGALAGGSTSSYAFGINDKGEVVGTRVTSAGQHAYIWDVDNGLRELGTHPQGVGWAINESSTVVGSWNPGWIRAAQWNASGMVDLGTAAGGPYSEATAINDHGYVVQNDWSFSGEPGAAYVRSPSGAVTRLPSFPGYAWTIGTGINNAGQVCGHAEYYWTDRWEAFVWNPSSGVLSPLGALPGDIYSAAQAINESGTVVGSSWVTLADTHACLWDPTNGIRDLGVLGDAMSYAWAYGINDSGTVVGMSLLSSTVSHAFIWSSDDGMVDLNDYIADLTGWQYLDFAYGINNNGWIVGYGHRTNGAIHAFLLTPSSAPVPAPGALLLAGLGVGLVHHLRRRGCCR